MASRQPRGSPPVAGNGPARPVSAVPVPRPVGTPSQTAGSAAASLPVSAVPVPPASTTPSRPAASAVASQPPAAASAEPAAPEPSPTTAATLAPPIDALPPPPSDGPVYDSIESLMQSLNDFGLQHGYTLIRGQGSNYHNGKCSRWIISCDRGRGQKSKSQGVRAINSRKTGCPFQGIAKAPAKMGRRWQFTVTNPNHNHGPSEGSIAHTTRRRLTPEIQSVIEVLAREGVAPRVTQEVLSKAFPKHPLIMRDIYNAIQRYRRDSRMNEENVKAAEETSPEGAGTQVPPPANS